MDETSRVPEPLPRRRPERLLTPGEVAAMLRVDPKTVTRWGNTGKIERIRTPGGHSRFRESQIRKILEGEDAP